MNDTIQSTDTYAREDAWKALYDGAMAGCRGHRLTGQRTAEARRAGKGYAAPLPGHVDEGTAHDGFMNALMKAPVALRWQPTDANARRIVGNATAFQATVAARPQAFAPGMPSRSRPTSVERSLTVRQMEAQGWCADPAEQLATLEEAAAILGSLTEGDRETLARHRAGLGAPDGVKPAAWRKRLSRARDAARAAIADRA